jgi:hypothetical protein
MKRPPRTSEEEIVKLQQDVRLLWESVEALLPEEFAALLKSYGDCGTLGEAMVWHDKVIEKIMATAEPREGASNRVRCPLCKGSSTSPYDDGFVYPGGLRRHLEGEANARECPIMRASRIRAVDYALDARAQEFRRHLPRVTADENKRRLARRKREGAT